MTPENRIELDEVTVELDQVTREKMEDSPRAALFYIGHSEYHTIFPPPGWNRDEVRDDGVRWINAKKRLSVIASVAAEGDEKLWLHVSCAHSRRIPTYEEMAKIKNIFIGEDRYAISVMPPKKFHVNIHEHCLHWWSCFDGHPLPEFSSNGTL